MTPLVKRFSLLSEIRACLRSGAEGSPWHKDSLGDLSRDLEEVLREAQKEKNDMARVVLLHRGLTHHDG